MTQHYDQNISPGQQKLFQNEEKDRESKEIFQHLGKKLKTCSHSTMKFQLPVLI